MIDFAMVSATAALIDSSLSAMDRFYELYQDYRDRHPAGLTLRANASEQVLVYQSTTDASMQVVMTYEELATKLQHEDLNFIASFEKRMTAAVAQWESLNASLPSADPLERAKIEAHMAKVKTDDICPSLTGIVDFIDSLGIDLYDHYKVVRRICLVD